MKAGFKKGEKLKSSQLIDLLFTQGKRLSVYPILLTYLQTEHPSDYRIQAGFSVPKKRFKKAVDRNRIKRQLREAYRLEKNNLQIINKEGDTKKYILMFVYISNEKLDYTVLSESMQKILNKFQAVIK